MDPLIYETAEVLSPFCCCLTTAWVFIAGSLLIVLGILRAFGLI